MTAGGARRAAVVLLGALAGVALLVRTLETVEVRGRSMLPALRPGDRLLVVRLLRPPRPGEVVVAADPRDPRRELIKRVATVDATGVALVSDNPAGREARVPPRTVAWRAVARYWPPARVGRLS
jgi:phage repressor protein C with HTH and peptisase S24 domain